MFIVFWLLILFSLLAVILILTYFFGVNVTNAVEKILKGFSSNENPEVYYVEKEENEKCTEEKF